MSTVLLDTNAALEAHVLQVLRPVLGESNLAFPNVAFTPTQGTPWARMDHLPAKTSAASAGVNGLTLHPGILQVSLFFPLGNGAGASLQAAQALCDGFKRGTSLSRGDTAVRVESVSRGPGMRDEGWWHTPVSVLWWVHTVD
ncbi:hypothetical protein HR086_43340 [Myxococcus sp. CA039A]|nr:hypothetical protein [Myxococcus sp. CA039A]